MGRAPNRRSRQMEDKMRRYDGEQKNVLVQVICNQCKKELNVEKGYLKEGCFPGEVVFGYFSSRDGIRHRFDLCEECYDRMIGRFQVPVEEVRENELL